MKQGDTRRFQRVLSTFKLNYITYLLSRDLVKEKVTDFSVRVITLGTPGRARSVCAWSFPILPKVFFGVTPWTEKSTR